MWRALSPRLCLLPPFGSVTTACSQTHRVYLSRVTCINAANSANNTLWELICGSTRATRSRTRVLSRARGSLTPTIAPFGNDHSFYYSPSYIVPATQYYSKLYNFLSAYTTNACTNNGHNCQITKTPVHELHRKSFRLAALTLGITYVVCLLSRGRYSYMVIQSRPLLDLSPLTSVAWKLSSSSIEARFGVKGVRLRVKNKFDFGAGHGGEGRNKTTPISLELMDSTCIL